LTAFNRTRDYC